jgi:flagellar biosynthesis/type III secretory pathway protein FliH
MVENTVNRYERSIQQLAIAHRSLTDAMEGAAVRLSLEIARKIIQRETTIDADLVAAMVTVALKRVNGHHGIEVRVNSHDYKRVSETFAVPTQQFP